jgi:predicted HicB family RNase H-like nuclease
MSQLTVSLPDPLHHQLITLANHTGVSLNQYLVSLLTRQHRYPITTTLI